MADRIRSLRSLRGWSQAELATRSGVTRSLVAAVEAGRQAPSVHAALQLARALETSVEELFQDADHADVTVVGSRAAIGSPDRQEEPTPVRVGQVGDRRVAVAAPRLVDPTERWWSADALMGGGRIDWLPGARPASLVIAGCDPVLGMLTDLVQEASGHRLLAVHATTASAVQALNDGQVHGVMVHGRDGELPRPSTRVARWHVARWQVGLASPPGRPSTLDELSTGHLAVVQRDPGASSQRALLRALQEVGGPARIAGPTGQGHVDVARRVAEGGGHAGVTIEAAAHAFGLGFTPLEDHVVELWIADRYTTLPAARAFLDMLSGRAFLTRASCLHGYDLAGCGTGREAV